MTNNQPSVSILFSGGSDSSLTAYRMSLEFDKVHLLTYKQFGQMDIENGKRSFAILSDHQLFELDLRPQANIKDDIEMYKKYQGYCKFMPGGILFLKYWKSCKGFPEKVQLKMKEHWLEEVDFMKSIIQENINVSQQL